MASILALKQSAATLVASRSSSRRPATTIKAQAQSMRAPEQQQQHQAAATRGVQAQAASFGAAAALVAPPAEEGTFLSHLARFFNAAPAAQQRPEEEEWRTHFGHLLDEHEELGAKHTMYGSHLAERMALEPRARS